MTREVTEEGEEEGEEGERGGGGGGRRSRHEVASLPISESCGKRSNWILYVVLFDTDLLPLVFLFYYFKLSFVLFKLNKVFSSVSD